LIGEAYDLGIENGTLVTSSGRERSHLYIQEGRIAALRATPARAAERIDASGLLVMPGMVDTHVHLMDPGATDREDYLSGTAAAAAAGVTTIVEHTHTAPVRDASAFRERIAYLQPRARVDFGLAAHATPGRPEEVACLWQAGATFLKVFTCSAHDFPTFDNAGLLDLFREVARSDAICLVHCEDEAITQAARARLRAQGRSDAAALLEWRSLEAELTAIAAVASLAWRTGARIVVAHVSHPLGVALIDRARQLGARLTAETCPQYLTFLAADLVKRGALLKFRPPPRARNAEELDALWRLVDAGNVQVLSTDHAPATRAQKQSGSIWEAHFGIPGLDTAFPLLLDAAARGQIRYERIVSAYSENPARTYRLHPRKGSLAVGADADLVLVDPGHPWTLRDSLVLTKAAWTPFDGRTVTGRPVTTLLRGRVIAREGEVLAEPGTGRWLPGPGYVSRSA